MLHRPLLHKLCKAVPTEACAHQSPTDVVCAEHLPVIITFMTLIRQAFERKVTRQLCELCRADVRGKAHQNHINAVTLNLCVAYTRNVPSGYSTMRYRKVTKAKIGQGKINIVRMKVKNILTCVLVTK